MCRHIIPLDSVSGCPAGQTLAAISPHDLTGRYKADSATVKVSESDYRAMFGITQEVCVNQANKGQ